MENDHRESEHDANLLDEFHRRCAWILLLGAACIVAGCTVVLPFFTLKYAYKTCDLSSDLGIDELPAKARFGIFLAVIFGGIESLLAVNTIFDTFLMVDS